MAGALPLDGLLHSQLELKRALEAAACGADFEGSSEAASAIAGCSRQAQELLSSASSLALSCSVEQVLRPSQLRELPSDPVRDAALRALSADGSKLQTAYDHLAQDITFLLTLDLRPSTEAREYVVTYAPMVAKEYSGLVDGHSVAKATTTLSSLVSTTAAGLDNEGSSDDDSWSDSDESQADAANKYGSEADTNCGSFTQTSAFGESSDSDEDDEPVAPRTTDVAPDVPGKLREAAEAARTCCDILAELSSALYKQCLMKEAAQCLLAARSPALRRRCTERQEELALLAEALGRGCARYRQEVGRWTEV